jgi:hypothetical protein
MTKIQSVGQISCSHLRDAYERARKMAHDQAVLPGGEVLFDSELNNQVSTKGTLVGKDSCTECGKRITVTLNLARIEAKVSETQRPIKLFSRLSGSESINVSGHKCVERG